MCSLAVASAVGLGGATTFSAQIRRPSGRPPAPPAARHPPLKAIFEPVHYAQDVEFSDVFFVDAQTGWACGRHPTNAGDGGFVIATRDGGKTWSVQHGDPHSPTRAVARLFFVDATHGWATQVDGTMLRTMDGSSWSPAGDARVPGAFVFTSPRRGFAVDGGSAIQRTVDGGGTWQPVYQCRVIVAGVAHEQNCTPEAIAFAPDHTTGYVVTRALDDRASAAIKTTDGGETWHMTSMIADTNGRDGSLAFADSLTGYLRADGSLSMTVDGGQTWHGVDATIPAGSPAILAAGSVAWMVGGSDFSYTFDDGKRWNARKIAFPTPAVRFSLPTPDTGYVVGHHGMVYRYRVVPFEAVVPNMLGIPGMTALVPDGSPQF